MAQTEHPVALGFKAIFGEGENGPFIEIYLGHFSLAYVEIDKDNGWALSILDSAQQDYPEADCRIPLKVIHRFNQEISKSHGSG